MNGYRSNSERLDFMRAFKLLMEEPHAWNNLLLGAVFAFLPIVGSIALLGWQGECYRRLAKGKEHPLPRLDFKDFVTYLERGWIPFVASFLVLLPWLLVLVLGIVLIGGLSGFLVRDPMHSSAGLWILFGIILIGVYGLSLVFYSILLNATLTRSYLTLDLGATLNLEALWNYSKGTWKNWLMVALVMIPVSFVVMGVGSLIFFVGSYLAMVVLGIANTHLSWQVYDIYLFQGGAPIFGVEAKPLPSELAVSPTLPL